MVGFKIDMALVRGINEDRIRRSIIQWLLYFSREIRTQVMAEGIETEEKYNTLRDMWIQYFR